MIIHNKFIGGNIFVDRIEGSHVYLRNEQRDTMEVNGKDRFYWAFVVEGAEGQELTFHFGKRRLGIFGPTVSHDLVEWHWLDQNEDRSFTYKFGENESRVYFAHHILYHPAHFSAFLERNGLRAEEFCKSRKGHSIPCLRLGDGSRSIILTARHHACESVSNYILEGLIEELIREPMEDTRILMVPFIDYDGVVDGDQGKNRYPHDFMRWHDIRIDEYHSAKAIKDAEERKEFYAQFAEIAQKYISMQGTSKHAFVAVIAMSPADLIKEGAALHHCVGKYGYDRKFVKEQTLIFFIRSTANPDTPLATVEYSVKQKKILQCYADRNTTPSKDVMHYVNDIWLPHANKAIKKIAA